MLNEKGLLLRGYTQNIDDLESRAGLPVFDFTKSMCQIFQSVGIKRRESVRQNSIRPAVIPLHGSLKYVVCTVCQHRREFGEDIIEKFGQGEMIECLQCKLRSDERLAKGRRRIQCGIYRPDIVLYNETHPYGESIADFVGLDLDMMPTTVIVMGTSLKVPGLKKLVKDLSKAVRAKRSISSERAGHIVFINKTPASKSEWQGIFDAELLGDCDDWIKLIEKEMDQLVLTCPKPLLMASPASVQKKITSFFKTSKFSTGDNMKEDKINLAHRFEEAKKKTSALFA